jgi:hypothetical protein
MKNFGQWVGRTPGPRGSPWTRTFQQADEGVGRGPGGPPHLVFDDGFNGYELAAAEESFRFSTSRSAKRVLCSM